MITICITADLHYGITPQVTLERLVDNIRQHKPELLILAGDLAECRLGPEAFRECLQIMRPSAPLVGVIAGNHDLWTEGEPTSKELWETILREITEDEDCWWLESQNIVLGGLSVVGSYLHYDYSAQDTVGVVSTFSKEYFWHNKKTLIPNEFRYLQGLPPDIDFAHTVGQAFQARLLESELNPAINRILVSTHVPCLEAQMTRQPHSFQWASGTPYFGNLSHQSFILACTKVRDVISGHSHRGRLATIERGQMLPVQVINLDSDYLRPTFRVIQIDTV